MECAVPQLARDGKARIARLVLDGRTIAALILLQSRDTAWAWKIAYDEGTARVAGRAAPAHATQSLLDDPAIARRFLRLRAASDDRHIGAGAWCSWTG